MKEFIDRARIEKCNFYKAEAVVKRERKNNIAMDVAAKGMREVTTLI